MNETFETGCCPRFNPEPWDEKEVSWTDKLFLQDRVYCLFYMPLNMNAVMVKNMKKLMEANAADPETIVLYECRSMWSANVYISLKQDIPGVKTARINGNFLTKVFEGPYKDSGKWARQMGEYVKAKGLNFEKLYFYYTTCPNCAKAYGKNYTVLLAQVPGAAAG